MVDDNIQHGIDDNPNNDPHKAKNLGGAGGALVGAVAGSAAGPLGTIAGAVVGGVVGAVASKEAVRQIDKIDNDNTITGIGGGVTTDVETQADHLTHGTVVTQRDAYGNVIPLRDANGNLVTDRTVDTPGNGIPGIQTGGHAVDGTPDTRGVTEKLADTLTGNPVDDKTGKRV